MTAVASPTRAGFRRRPELIVAGLGALGALVLQGGLAMVVLRSDEATLRDAVLPALTDAGVDLTGEAALVALETMAAWWGFSLIVVLALAAVGWFLATYRPRPRTTGWWFAAAGVVCLVGTQLVLYPVAFFFFLSAALFALRPAPARRSE